MSTGPLEVWRGTANAWECDHLGHMNTRFYLARVEEGLAALVATLGLPAARDRGSASAIEVQGQHMRFLREVKAGAAIHMVGMVLRWGDDDADLLFLLKHAGGELSASFRLQVQHRIDGAPAPWPAGAGRIAASFAGELPADAAPRCIDLDRDEALPSLAAANRVGLPRTGLGVILPDACDVQGRWRLSAFMGRVADSVGHLGDGGAWRETLARTAVPQPARIGGALVEFRVQHWRWPAVGDRCELRSGLAGCTDRVTYAMHWLLDPATGSPWAAVRAVGVALDLDARRMIRLTPEAQADYRRASAAALIL